jgi:hypothetical protein
MIVDLIAVYVFAGFITFVIALTAQYTYKKPSALECLALAMFWPVSYIVGLVFLIITSLKIFYKILRKAVGK